MTKSTFPYGYITRNDVVSTREGKYKKGIEQAFIELVFVSNATMFVKFKRQLKDFFQKVLFNDSAKKRIKRERLHRKLPHHKFTLQGITILVIPNHY